MRFLAKPFAFAGIFIALVLILAACGGGAASEPEPTAAAVEPEQESEAAPSEEPAPSAAETVQLGGNDDLGEFLVDAAGKTLYLFTKDEPSVSNCYDQCATNWPPLLAAEGEEPTAGSGVTGELSLIERTDGAMQVAYNGLPLYYFAGDAAAGDTNGQGVGEVWFVVAADADASALVAAAAETVQLGGNDDLGEFLVDAAGKTLYLFTKDEPGVSNCADQCAANWPPLLVAEGETPTAGAGVTGELSVIERADGGLQVAYNGIPLYYFASDTAAGDTNGQGVGEVWFVVAADAEAMAAAESAADQDMATGTVQVGGNEDLGEFLVDAAGKTLYLFTNDEPGVSNCADQCAANWPALLVAEGETPTAGPGVTGELSVIERADGGLQVAYNGIPLYYFAGDGAAGDTNGQGVGDVWFVVAVTAEEKPVTYDSDYN